MATYAIAYSTSGDPTIIADGVRCVPVDNDNGDFQAFLAANTGLDYRTKRAYTPPTLQQEAKNRFSEPGAMPRIVRAIAAVVTDEINILRAAVLPSPLPPRTLTQVKAAIAAKIDAEG